MTVGFGRAMVPPSLRAVLPFGAYGASALLLGAPAVLGPISFSCAPTSLGRRASSVVRAYVIRRWAAVPCLGGRWAIPWLRATIARAP